MYSNPLGTLTNNAEFNLTNKILALLLAVSDFYLLVNAVRFSKSQTILSQLNSIDLLNDIKL